MQVNDIINSLNLISEKLFKTVEGQIYKVIDDIIDISPNILKQEPLNKLFFENKVNGIIIIANSFILFYIVYYILIQLISIYNGKQIPNIYFFVVKIIIVSILVNNSYFLCSEVLEFFDAFTNAVEMYGNNISNEEITFENLKETILSIDDFMKSNLFSIDGLIKGIISFGIVSVLVNFSIRYVTVIFLILISPLAIMSSIAGITHGFFRSWIKMFTVNMMMQIVIKFVLIIPLVYKEVNTIMYKIVLVGSIYLIYKITTFTKELFMNINEKSDIKDIIYEKER